MPLVKTQGGKFRIVGVKMKPTTRAKAKRMLAAIHISKAKRKKRR